MKNKVIALSNNNLKLWQLILKNMNSIEVEIIEFQHLQNLTDFDSLVCLLFEADLTESFVSLIKTFKVNTDVIVILAQSHQPERGFWNRVFEINPKAMIDISEADKIHDVVIKCIHDAKLIEQNKELVNAISDLNQKYELLSSQLEERVQQRQNELIESKKITHIANLRWSAVQHSYIRLVQAQSLIDIELGLTESLRPTFKVSSVKIRFSPHDEYLKESLRHQEKLKYLAVVLKVDKRNSATVFFVKEESDFSKEESDFLKKFSDFITLSLSRLERQTFNVEAREQWQATFDSVSDPLAIITQDYQVVQSNKHFKIYSGKKKCYEILFNRQSPCVKCKLGQIFVLEQDHKTIQVISQKIQKQETLKTVYLNQYDDLTAQLKLEKKIIDSARLSEMGIISSSIAHEVNNPLGGILSFAQLLKLEFTKDHEFYKDLLAIENGVKRSQEIIDGLLIFSRDSLSLEKKSFYLVPEIQKIIKQIESRETLQDLNIRFYFSSEELFLNSHIGLFHQGVKNLFQICLDRFQKSRILDDTFKPTLEAQILKRDKHIEFTILDNSIGEEDQFHIPYVMAKHIIEDLGGHLEISFLSKNFRRTLVQF